MNDHSTDTALGDTTPSTGPAEGAAGGPFVSPEPEQPIDLTATKVWTIEEILAEAELPEARAKICLKANLQARWDQLVDELSRLVNSRGELIVDEDASIGDVRPAARAHAINDELQQLRLRMLRSMWYPLFRGKDSEEMAVFNKTHLPKTEGAPLTDYYNRLISECSVEPKLTIENVAALRKELGSAAINELVQTVQKVNVEGGVDVPKLPNALRNLAAA